VSMWIGLIAIVVLVAPVILWLRPRQMHERGADAGERPLPPDYIRNIAKWEEDCRRIHARAVDLIEGRLGVIEAAEILSGLAHWTGQETDPDLLTFKRISKATVLPIGADRSLCSAEMSERLDAEIARLEKQFRASALAAAESLARRYEWALEARKERRRRGRDES